MNKDRRKALNALQDRLTAVKALMQTNLDELEAIHSDLEAVRDEEQDAFDNLSENLQGSERGDTMEEAISSMDEAMGTIESIKDGIDLDEIDSAFANIEDAKGEA